MKPRFRHEEVQVGETWNYREDLSVFIVEVKEREVYKEGNALWLRLKLLVLDVVSGQEGWKDQELVVREREHSGHGMGMWTLRKITAPPPDSFKPESCRSRDEWEELARAICYV